MELKPIQAQALDEFATTNGGFFSIKVGGGKTLIAFLLPTLVQAGSPVFLTKPKLVLQAQRMYAEYSNHWRLPEIQFVSYSALSSIKHASILYDLTPDLIICDEAHTFTTGNSVRTKRFKHYLRSHPHTNVVFMSGSLVKGSLKKYAPLANLALGPMSPLPRTYPVMEEWAAALDPGPFQTPPGRLLEFCTPGETVEEGVGRRIFETVGCITSGNKEASTTNTFKVFKPKMCKEIHELLKKQNETWETPGGEVFMTALEKWRHDGELSCGFYYKRVWPNNEPKDLQNRWLDARREWKRELREFIRSQGRIGLDSPKLVEMAAGAGKIEFHNWKAWEEIKPLAKPKTEAVWVTMEYVEALKQWAQEHQNGLMWYEHDALGQMLIKHLNAFKGIKVLSRPGFGTGTDGLQKEFNKQLFTFPPSSQDMWEQTLGRLDREGQKSEEIETWVAWHTKAARGAFTSALEEAIVQQRLTGTNHKLVISDKEEEFYK